MKTLTPDFDEALRQRSIHYGFFCEIHGDTNIVRVWSGAGTKQWNGFDWKGVGRMGRVTGIGETSEVRIPETSYELIAPEIDPETQDFINNQARGNPARTWVALFDENERVIPEPLQLDESIINYAQVDMSEDMETVLRLVCNSAIFDFRQPANIAISHEESRVQFPDETGFDRISTFVTGKQIKWTRT